MILTSRWSRRPVAEPRLRVLSLGAGVQSTTLALMAAAGEMPMPDCAIFADTQWEPAAVYEHLAKLEATLPFPIYKVTAGAYVTRRWLESTSGGKRFAAIPWFTLSPRGKPGIGRPAMHQGIQTASDPEKGS